MDELARLLEVGKVLSSANESAIRAALAALQKVLDTMGSTATESLRQLEEATWDTAYMNTLPDTAFLHVAAGGKKDADGKTVPRNLRYFPVYDDSGKLDLPHLRNALAQIPKSTIPQTDKDAAIAKAQALAKKNLPNYKESLGEAGDMSFDDIRSRLSSALKTRMNLGDNVDGPWVTDVFPDRLIYQLSGKYFQLTYTIDDKDNVTIGEPVEVARKTVYEPVAQESLPSESVDGELLLVETTIGGRPQDAKIMPLQEKALRADGTTDIKVIDPGWGSSGFYGKDMLVRDASNAWPAGTKMYLDHPTIEEDRQRPERSLRDLSAETTESAGWQENGWDGPGVYAPIKVFAPFQSFIEEYGPHIGVSHRSLGKAVKGEAEGKKGLIIEEIVAGKSIDFVTMPGRGGKIRELYESARPATEITYPEEGTKPKEVEMDEAKLKELEEANKTLEEAKTAAEAENARLKETQVLREAHDLTAEKVGKSDLPDVTKARLIETLPKTPVLKEGALDKEEFGKVIDEAVKAEVDYVAQLTGSGKIKGMGASQGSEGSRERLEESYKRTGLTDEQAKIAAKGR